MLTCRSVYEGSFFLGFERGLTGRLGGVLGGDPKSSSSLSVSQAGNLT